MADRRVERRDFMSGSGMLNDPDRLAEIESRRQQSELNARLPPKVSFREVLQTPKKPAKPKPKRPYSKEKLRPNGPRQVTGFEDADEALGLEGEAKSKIVVKV